MQNGTAIRSRRLPAILCTEPCQGFDVPTLRASAPGPVYTPVCEERLRQLWSSKAQASKKVVGCSISVTDGRKRAAPEKISSVPPGYDVTTWYGVFAPRDTPGAIIAKLNTVINESLKEEAVQKRLTTAGVVVRGSPPRPSASTWRASSRAGTRCARRRAFPSSSSEPSAICQLSGQSGPPLLFLSLSALPQCGYGAAAAGPKSRCSGLLAAP